MRRRLNGTKRLRAQVRGQPRQGAAQKGPEHVEQESEAATGGASEAHHRVRLAEPRTVQKTGDVPELMVWEPPLIHCPEGHLLRLRLAEVPSGVEELCATLEDAKGGKVALLGGTYLLREPDEEDFLETCASKQVPKQLRTFAPLLFDATGRPKGAWRQKCSPKAMSGGLLFLEEVRSVGQLKGKKLLAHFVLESLKCLAGPMKRLTLVILLAAPSQDLAHLVQHHGEVAGRKLWWLEPAAALRAAANPRPPLPTSNEAALKAGPNGECPKEPGTAEPLPSAKKAPPATPPGQGQPQELPKAGPQTPKATGVPFAKAKVLPKGKPAAKAKAPPANKEKRKRVFDMSAWSAVNGQMAPPLLPWPKRLRQRFKATAAPEATVNGHKVSLPPPPELPTAQIAKENGIPQVLALTPRSRLALTYAAAAGAATLRLEAETLQPGVATATFWGCQSFPQATTEKGVFKAFLHGMVEVLEIVRALLVQGLLPTVDAALAALRPRVGIAGAELAISPNRHCVSHFFGRGGKPEYVLQAVIDEAEAFMEACERGQEDLLLEVWEWAASLYRLPPQMLDGDFDYVRQTLTGGSL